MTPSAITAPPTRIGRLRERLRVARIMRHLRHGRCADCRARAGIADIAVSPGGHLDPICHVCSALRVAARSRP